MAAADSFSRLPDDLLVHVISFLPVRDAARTAVISRRWRPLWLCTDTLNLDSRSYDDLWNLAVPDPRSYNFPDASQVKARLFSDAGAALRAAGRRPVRQLSLFVKGHDDRYCEGVLGTSGPDWGDWGCSGTDAYDHMAALLAVEELLHIAEPRLGFKSVQEEKRIKPPQTGDVLPCLSVLRLYKCSSSTKDLKDFISATRSLRSLHIQSHDFHFYRDGGDRFAVNCPSVTTVTLVGLQLGSSEGIELDAPCLRTFKYSGHPVDFSVKLPVTELAPVEIALTTRPRNYHEPGKAWVNSLCQFLRNLRHTKILKLKVPSIEGIANVEHEHLVTLLGLERLEIEGPCDPSRRSDAAAAIANLLQSCPAIRDLHIRIVDHDVYGMVIKDVSPPHFDVSLDLFERRYTKEIRVMIDGEHGSPVVIADLPGLTGRRFNCLQNHLKNVKLQFVLKEMNSFEVSLAKFLAGNCMVLEILEIDDGKHNFLSHINLMVERWRTNASEQSMELDSANARRSRG